MSVSSLPDIRVYLFTYRRNDLLPRALQSLLAQTHQNWICELHNDDPGDQYPQKLVAQLDDRRVHYIHHSTNLGAVETFNEAFKLVAEPFISILEDDNWWEPDFLETMLILMKKHPAVNVAWANMWFSREMADGSWQREGTIWPIIADSATHEFSPPTARQVCGALHSNGAMLIRASDLTLFKTPPSLPFFAIEPLRERAYPGPLLLVRRPLANFALTRASARGESADENMQILVLLARTFLENADATLPFLRRVWHECRGSLGHKHRALIVAAIHSGHLGQMLRAGSWLNLAVVAAWALRHPRRLCRLFHAATSFPEVADFLDDASRRRSTEWNLTLAQSNPANAHGTSE